MFENKKEALARFHRENIIRVAEKLFVEKGIGNTSMDSIAKEAQYSKATIYVYFKNKEEIISCITLISMKLYLNHIVTTLAKSTDFKQQYYDLCYSLVEFHTNYPFYYECMLKEINVDLELPETPPIYKEIFDIGEEINHVIGSILKKGIMEGCIRSDLSIIKTIFILWAGISGVIKMAAEKEKYLTKYYSTTKDDFLKSAFDMLFKTIIMY